MHFGTEKDFFLDEADRSVLSMKMMLKDISSAQKRKKSEKRVRFNLTPEGSTSLPSNEI